MRYAFMLWVLLALGCTDQGLPPRFDCDDDADCVAEARCDRASSMCIPATSIDGTFNHDGQFADSAINVDMRLPAMSLDFGRMDAESSLDSTAEIDARPQREDASTADAVTDIDQDLTVADASTISDQALELDAMPPRAPNLLTDHSFEDNNPIWNIYGGAERVDDVQYDGTFSLRVRRRGGAEQLVEGLQPNSKYRLSGWGLSEDDEPTLIGVKNHGFGQRAIQFSTSAFTESEIIFTTGFGTTSAIIFAYKHEGNDDGFADDLSLTYVGPGDAQPIWAEEFDGSGPVDPNRWGFEEGFVRNEEAQWYQSQNAFKENGVLVIEARSERRRNPNYDDDSNDWRREREFIEYTSASINTRERFSFQYGRLVVRAKVTNLPGTWPAIWTLGTTCEWPSNGEVDVMENYDDKILANFAWGSNRRWRPQWDVVRKPVDDFDEDWTERFHIWELHWTENQMQILLDGELLNEVDLNRTINGSAACAGQNPFRQPHYILLNLALGGQGGDVGDTPLPTRYLVDYVRVYP